MSAEHTVQDLSFPVKVYVGLVHLLLLFLVVLFLQRPFKKRDGDEDSKQGRKSRTITKDNRAVTIESCEWINSTLAWFYMHAQGNANKDRTPNIVKLWIRALNKQLQKDKKKNQRIVIDTLSPGCLPPKLTSVYCLCVSGSMQCITFHVESADLGFLIRVLRQTDKGVQTSHLETRVVKLTGEVALQLNTAPSKLEISVQFIGVPEIVMSTKCLTEGGEVDAADVQEKVKEVICKTITSIPLSDAASRERLNSESSSASKERLDSPSSVSCAGEEGKLLVKVIKASGLCTKDKTGPISPYCIISTSNPVQRKRTSMLRDNDNPFWNEYFTFEITPKTKEITLDIYNYERTEKDDYLGQVIVPLSTVNRDQTCRLILPVLPKSSKSDHSKGDISLEFTFDKDGKVIDATLPIIGNERPSAHSSPSEDTPSAYKNGVDAGVVNGHVPVRKRYIESSLDELAMEIEAYEHGEGETPKTNGYHDDEQVPEMYKQPETHREPVSLPAVVAEPEAEPEPGPSHESEQKDEDELVAIAELIKATEQEVEEESKVEESKVEKSKVEESKVEERSEEESKVEERREEESKMEESKMEESKVEEGKEKAKEIEDESNEKHDKGQEEKELKEKEDVEDQTAKEPEEKTEEPSLKPKHRRSFNLFKRRKADKKEEKREETGAGQGEAPESDKKEEVLVEDEGEKKETEGEDKREDEKTEEGKEDDEQKAKEEEPGELETKHKARRSFRLFKRKPQAPTVEVETHKENVDGEEEKKEIEAEETKEDVKTGEVAEADKDKQKEVKESAEPDVEFDSKQKVRRSFNLFKRRPQSTAAVLEEETQEEVTEEEHVEDKEATTKSEGDEDKETEAEVKKEEDVKVEEKDEGVKEMAKEQEESVEPVPEFDTKPKLRRSFNMFRRRPQSMAVADRKTDEESEQGALSRHDPVRHSYHAGDLPVAETSNLRKSTSQSSLLSYFPNPHSTLIIETVSKGQKKYSHIPPVMAKRGAYEKGNKLHIYNDHIFTAVHFTGSPPECAVCSKSIKGKVGKQGYQCRGCKMVTHRDCHYETTVMCSSDAVKQMEIEYIGDADV